MVAATGGGRGFGPALTSFVGRGEAAALLDEYRLVTVTAQTGTFQSAYCETYYTAGHS